MADIISGVRHIGPPYPLKPVQPSNKDREPSERQKKDQRKPNPEERHDEERHDNDKPTIDEHV